MKSRFILTELAAFMLVVVFHRGAECGFGESQSRRTASDLAKIADFEKQLDSLRGELKIPAISAGIVKDGKLMWAKGFGYADLEKKIPATERTPYHLASLTKTFASTIIMQLVQEGKVALDDPVTRYGITLESEGVIRVKHLLSHTSEGVPGERYRYNGDRFGELDKVIEASTGKSFAELLFKNILDPLVMEDTAPNLPPIPKAPEASPSDEATIAEVEAALSNLVTAYNAGDLEGVKRHYSPFLTGFDPDGGRLSTFFDESELRLAFSSGGRLNLEIDGIRISAHGTAAVVTCTMSGTLTFPGETVHRLGPWRSTFVLTKEGPEWQIVHVHQSTLSTYVTAEHQKRSDEVFRRIAAPYRLDSDNRIVRGEYPTHFSTAAGLISSVVDIATYDMAIEQDRFLNPETQKLAFTATISTRGDTLPYGLGWFVQDYLGSTLIWHYGYWTCNSSLILKVPQQKLTFIVLANTDNWSRPTDLGAGDVLRSPMAMAFLRTTSRTLICIERNS